LQWVDFAEAAIKGLHGSPRGDRCNTGFSQETAKTGFRLSAVFSDSWTPAEKLMVRISCLLLLLLKQNVAMQHFDAMGQLRTCPVLDISLGWWLGALKDPSSWPVTCHPMLR